MNTSPVEFRAVNIDGPSAESQLVLSGYAMLTDDHILEFTTEHIFPGTATMVAGYLDDRYIGIFTIGPGPMLQQHIQVVLSAHLNTYKNMSDRWIVKPA